MPDFLQRVRDGVVIYDGAMGTNVQRRNPSVDDFWGNEGCNEILVLSRPDIIKDIHASFLNVGCDVLETDTFGATRVVLAEYDLQDKVREINVAAAKIAKEVAQQFSSNGKPRFVAGSIGPTTKLPSLGHITFDNMAAGYEEQASACRSRFKSRLRLRARCCWAPKLARRLRPSSRSTSISSA